MRFYLFLISSSFFNNLILFTLMPFFPIISKEKNISITIIGILLTIFSIGSCIPILLIKYFKDSNPFKLIITSNYTIQIFLIIFGFLNYIQDKYIFCISNAVILFFLGGLDAFDQSIIYGSIGIVYKNDQELKNKRFAFAKFVGNSGQIVGCLLGGFLYNYFGYSGMFLIVAMLNFIITSIFTILLSNKIKEYNQEEEEDAIYEKQNYQLRKIFFSKKIFISFIFLLISTSVCCIIRPGFPINLKEAFDIKKSKVSYYYSFLGFGIAMGNISIIFFMKYIGYMTIINLSFLMGIIGLVFIGPSTFIGLPLNIFYYYSGINIHRISNFFWQSSYI